MRKRIWAVLVAAAGCASGNGGASEEAGVPVPLTDNAAWMQVGAAEDPLASHRPTEVSCPEGSYGLDGAALDIESGYCNYLALGQPLREDVAVGETLHAIMWHADLVFEEPTSAHVAWIVEEDVLWQRTIEIPAKAEIYDVTFQASRDFPEGTPVVLHLHNHGFNSWNVKVLEKL